MFIGFSNPTGLYKKFLDENFDRCPICGANEKWKYKVGLGLVTRVIFRCEHCEYMFSIMLSDMGEKMADQYAKADSIMKVPVDAIVKEAKQQNVYKKYIEIIDVGKSNRHPELNGKTMELNEFKGAFR